MTRLSGLVLFLLVLTGCQSTREVAQPDPCKPPYCKTIVRGDPHAVPETPPMTAQDLAVQQYIWSDRRR